jgi:hypothetical protein
MSDFTKPVPNSPINAFWTYPPIPRERCINSGAVYQSLSVVNTVSEFAIAIFPIIGAYTLRVDVRQRWHVISLLSLGFLVTIAGCFRCFYVWKTVGPKDPTWWSSAQWLCSEIEINLAMVRNHPALHNARKPILTCCPYYVDLRMCCTSTSTCGTIHLPDKPSITNLDHADSVVKIFPVSQSRIDLSAGKWRTPRKQHSTHVSFEQIY